MKRRFPANPWPMRILLLLAIILPVAIILIFVGQLLLPSSPLEPRVVTAIPTQTPTPSPSPAPPKPTPIQKVHRLDSHIFVATQTTVSRYSLEGSQLQELIRIEASIVDFDIAVSTSQSQTVFTATLDGVWQIDINGNTVSKAVKVINLANIRKVAAQYSSAHYDVFVLAHDGLHEYHLQAGQIRHQQHVVVISNSAALILHKGVNGSDEIYIGVDKEVYELKRAVDSSEWIKNEPLIVLDDTVTSIEKYNLSDGAELLYASDATSTWQRYCKAGVCNPIGDPISLGENGVVALKRAIDSNGFHQLFIATPGYVKERWWNDPVHGTTMVLNTKDGEVISSIDLYSQTDQVLYVAIGQSVYEVIIDPTHQEPPRKEVFKVNQ